MSFRAMPHPVPLCARAYAPVQEHKVMVVSKFPLQPMAATWRPGLSHPVVLSFGYVSLDAYN